MPHARRPSARRRPAVALVVLAAAACIPSRSASAADATAATSRAASRPAAPSPADVQAAVDDLAAADFDTRERAAAALWRAGDAAVPALKAATRSGNPEAARRARSILASFASGVRPDTPAAVLQFLAAYRRGNVEERQQAVGNLAQAGVAGARILLVLTRSETDPDMKRRLSAALVITARPSAATLLASDDVGAAADLLAAVAGEAPVMARDHAAFLLLHGGIDEAASALAAAAERSPADEVRLACLLRATGKLPDAIKAAEAGGDAPFADAVRAEAGRYDELADKAEGMNVAGASVEQLGSGLAYARMAGRETAADRWADRLVERGRTSAGDRWDVVEALMLNGRSAAAIPLLDDEPLTALEFVGPRFDFDRTDRIVDRAEKTTTPDLPRILAKAAPMLNHRGRGAEAATRLEAIVRGEHGPVNLAVWSEVIEAAPAAGVPQATVDGWLAQALSSGGGGGGQRLADPPERLLWKARLADPERARQWWQALRDHRAGLTPADAMALVRRLDRGQVVGDEWRKLVDRTKEQAAALPPPERTRRLVLVADALADKKQYDEAIAIYGQVASQLQGGFGPTRLGDLNAKAGRWAAALDWYAKAAEAEPADPVPVALGAWCLNHLGKVDESKARMALAHLMPLSDEAARGTLAAALDGHGLKAEAARERELVLKLGDPRSLGYADALRRQAATLSTAEPLKASAMFDRA